MNHRYILALEDYFTECCKDIPLKQTDAVMATDVILNKWILKWSNFESALLQELCTDLGMDKIKTIIYHPQGNGQVESTNRSIKALLETFADPSPKDWDKTLRRCLLACNITIQRSMDQTPRFLWTGRKIGRPSDNQIPVINRQPFMVTVYASKVIDHLGMINQTTLTHVEAADGYQKDYYDKSISSPFFNLETECGFKGTRQYRRY